MRRHLATWSPPKPGKPVQLGIRRSSRTADRVTLQYRFGAECPDRRSCVGYAYRGAASTVFAMSTPDERPVHDPATWAAPTWQPPAAGVIDLREQSRQQHRPAQDGTSHPSRLSGDDSSEADVPERPGDPLREPYDDGRTSLLGLEDGPELSLSEAGSERMPWESGPLSGDDADPGYEDLGYDTGEVAPVRYDGDPLAGSGSSDQGTAEHATPEHATPDPVDGTPSSPPVSDAVAATMAPARRARTGEPTWISGSRTVPVEGRRMSADDLRTRRGAVQAPQRRGVRRLLGGRNDALLAEQRRRDRLAKLRAPLPEGHRLAVVSLKGGVGKTTATAVLGATLATLRTDRIVAIDANPDRGTLAEKIDRTTDATVRDLVHAGDRLDRYTTLQTYINQTESRLEVLASESDPAASHALDEADYSKALDVLERYYNVILTDCGTGLLHAATRAALSNADSVVVVSSASMDGARSASATLDWLEAHGREDLARSAVAIVNEIRPDVDPDDVRQIEEHFRARCRAVERVPYDPHLAAGDVISLEELMPGTREAFERVAAAVLSGAAAGGRPAE